MRATLSHRYQKLYSKVSNSIYRKNGHVRLSNCSRKIGQTDKPADTNRIWCILALNLTSGGNNFNDFLDNQLIKFRVIFG